MRFGLGWMLLGLALPLAVACSSAKSTPDNPVDSGTDATKDVISPDDVAVIDGRPVDDGAIPPKCPTWHAVMCGGVP